MAEREAAPAYLWYPADFLASSRVVAMTPLAELAYRRLLDYSWMDGSVPENCEACARLARLSFTTMRKLWPLVRPCFVALDGHDGRMVNARQERDRAALHAKRAMAAVAGKAGAKARWKHGDRMRSPSPSDAVANAIAMRNDGLSYSSSRTTTPYSPPVGDDAKGDEILALLDAFDASLIAGLCPSRKPPRRTAAQRQCASRLLRDHGAPAVLAILDFYSGTYRPAPEFDWREHITSLVYVERKWPQLDGERLRQITGPTGAARRDPRLGQAEPTPREHFTTTRRVAL
jgi:uncharacterized protein YdaU (DUF1376 family)